MGKQAAHILYDKYFQLNNQNVEVTLKNGNILRGKFIGFYKAEDNDGPYITHMHIAEQEQRPQVHLESLGEIPGVTVDEHDIATIRFQEDGTVLDF